MLLAPFRLENWPKKVAWASKVGLEVFVRFLAQKQTFLKKFSLRRICLLEIVTHKTKLSFICHGRSQKNKQCLRHINLLFVDVLKTYCKRGTPSLALQGQQYFHPVSRISSHVLWWCVIIFSSCFRDIKFCRKFSSNAKTIVTF